MFNRNQSIVKNKSWKKFRSGADLTSHEVTQGCLIKSLKYKHDITMTDT